MTVRTTYPPSSRPVVMGTDGMVSTGHPLASMAGVRVLAEGGNAFVAAVAVAFTLGVVEPYMSGPGGTGTAILRVAGEPRSNALEFSGRTPAAATRSELSEEALIERGHEVELLDAWSADVGGAQAIAYDPEQGVLQGGADRRRDGFAFGLQ